VRKFGQFGIVVDGLAFEQERVGGEVGGFRRFKEVLPHVLHRIQRTNLQRHAPSVQSLHRDGEGRQLCDEPTRSERKVGKIKIKIGTYI
jgi:hypothetical protein